MANTLDSYATLQRSGYDDNNDDAAMAAQANAFALSAVDNLGRAQRACGLPVTGANVPT